MPHPRQVIRDQVVAILAGATSAGASVFAARRLPIRTAKLPALLVYTAGETSDDVDATAPRELRRVLDVDIAGLIDGSGMDERALEDALDSLALEIEIAMHADRYLSGRAAETTLVSTEQEIAQEGDRLLGRITLTYEVTYRTIAPEPPLSGDMDDFIRARTTHQVGDQAPAIAEDEFTVQEP